MKKLLTGILLLVLSTFALAKDIDITKSKGTDQNVIVLLTPSVANIDVDKDVILKAVFNVDLDAKHVKKNDIKLKYITQTKESIIDGNVEYIEEEKAVTFTPNNLLKDGFYEIEFKSLKTLKEEKDNQIKEIKYRFYVPEVINGYKLPIEPDPAVSNATLLGIDSNDNGIRDDVERYIVIRFQGFENALVDRSIALQYAKATQIVIQNPEMAWENKTYEVMEKAGDCKWYYYDTHLKDIRGFRNRELYRQKHKIFDAELKDKIFNTRERLEAYLNYNDDLSGQVFDDSDETKEKCDFDIDSLLGSGE